MKISICVLTSADLVSWQEREGKPKLGGLTGQMAVTVPKSILSFPRGAGVYIARSTDPELDDLDIQKVLLWCEDSGAINLKDFQTPVDTCFWHSNREHLFANDRQCVTVRVYPTIEVSKTVSLLARGGEARLKNLTAWQMLSIWPDLKHMKRK